ncbi:MAG: L,D-transpeptidase family protein [Marmoricola sp.]
MTVSLVMCLAPAAQATTTTITLDGVRVALPAGTHQVITVRHTTSTYARAILWIQSTSGRWVANLRTSSARTGAGGLVSGSTRRQGTDTTPTGTYALPFGFGIDTVAGATYPYRKLTNADWWVEDNASIYYNRFRSSLTGFRWWLNPADVNGSEHLIRYRTPYQLALVIAFNYVHPVRYRGAGIFLHVNGSGATGGCVSVPRSFLYLTIQRLRTTAKPVIAIG